MKRLINVLLIVLVFVLASCSFDIGKDLNEMLSSFDGLELKRNEPVVVACNDDKFEISLSIDGSGYSYQWYKCNADKGDIHMLYGMTSNTLTANSPKERSIDYYYCEVSKGRKTAETQLFMVANTGLPLLNVTTNDSEPVLSKEKVKGNKLVLTVSDTFKDAHKKYSFTNAKTADVELNEIYLRGNFSYYGAWGKKSYNLKTEKKAELLNYKGSETSKKWVLSANANDHSFMKNWYATRMATVMNMDGDKLADNRWTPQQEFVDFVLNGRYMGIYSLYEKIRFENKGRIHVPSVEDFNPTSSTDDIHNYGFILEAGGGLDGVVFPSKRSGWGYALCDPDMEDESLEATKAVVDYAKDIMDRAEDCLYDGNFDEFFKLVDKQSLVDYFLVKEFIQETDGYRRSTYLWWNPEYENGKLFFGPLWDCDNCAKSEYDMFYLTDRAWISQLLKSPEFKTAVKERWDETADSIKEVIFEDFDMVTDYIDLSVQTNAQRWANLVSYDQWKSTSGEFHDWLKNRFNWFDKAIRTI